MWLKKNTHVHCSNWVRSFVTVFAIARPIGEILWIVEAHRTIGLEPLDNNRLYGTRYVALDPEHGVRLHRLRIADVHERKALGPLALRQHGQRWRDVIVTVAVLGHTCDIHLVAWSSSATKADTAVASSDRVRHAQEANVRAVDDAELLVVVAQLLVVPLPRDLRERIADHAAFEYGVAAGHYRHRARLQVDHLGRTAFQN